MSAADRVKYTYVKEATLGTTPAGPAMSPLRITGESLKVGFETAVSNELSSDRSEREQIVVGSNVGGDLQHELLWDGHNDFIAGACGQSAWTGAGPYTLDNGVSMPSFSILKQFTDLTDANHLFKGCVVNGWTLTVPKKGIVTGSFNLMGMTFANGTQDALLGTVPAPTFPAITTTDPVSGSSVTSLLLDDVPFTSCVDNISFQFSNNIRPQECLGNQAPTNFTLGRMQLTFSAEIYFKDEVLFNKYKNGQSFELDLVLTLDGNDTFGIEIPRAKFEDMEVVAGGTGTDVIAKCKGRALFDPTDARMFRLTRTLVA